MKIVNTLFDLFTYQEIQMFPVDAIKKKKKGKKKRYLRDSHLAIMLIFNVVQISIYLSDTTLQSYTVYLLKTFSFLKLKVSGRSRHVSK